MRQELPLRRAKTDDRVRPYIPMNGLYIRALLVALLAARLHFDMKSRDFESARAGDHASSRQGWRASVSSDAKGVKGIVND